MEQAVAWAVTAQRMRKTGKQEANCLGPQGSTTCGQLKIIPQVTRFAKRVLKALHHIRTLAGPGRSLIANSMPTKKWLPYGYRSWRRDAQTELGLTVTRKRRDASWNGTKKKCETSSFFRHLQEELRVPEPRRPARTNGQRSKMGARALCTLGRKFVRL